MIDAKQVIVVRKDLRTRSGEPIRRGKEIAQASHASTAWLTNRLRAAPGGASDVWIERGVDVQHVGLKFSAAEWAWVAGSFKKIVCQVDSEAALLAVRDDALARGVIVELITDSGLTEFDGPTVTCCAVGPDEASRVDAVTRHLKLY